MATARAVLLQKQIEGVLTDLMVRTNVQNVMLDSGQPLSSLLSTILTQQNVTEYVDGRINEILNVNPGLLVLLNELREALDGNQDVVTAILNEVALKASEADLALVSTAVGNLDTALGALASKVAANETAIANHGTRLGQVEGDIISLGNLGMLSQSSRILLSENVPADLRPQDLLLRIVDGAW